MARTHTKPPGRKKGTPNRLTREVKEAFLWALYAKPTDRPENEAQAFYHRIKFEHPVEFLKVSARMVPNESNAKVETEPLLRMDLRKRDEVEVVDDVSSEAQDEKPLH